MRRPRRPRRSRRRSFPREGGGTRAAVRAGALPRGERRGPAHQGAVSQARGGKDFVIVDAGMTDFVRPSHYNAHHEIVPLKDGKRGEETVSVVGPVCESGDFLALDRKLPVVMPGEALAVLGTGAYGFVMSSTYNQRPRPPEVVVEGDRYFVSRQRETLDDLLRGETAEPRRGTKREPDPSILDYGSQFTQLIARRIREAHVYCEIHPRRAVQTWRSSRVRCQGIILSGGPSSVSDPGAPPRTPRSWTSAFRCSAFAMACSSSLSSPVARSRRRMRESTGGPTSSSKRRRAVRGFVAQSTVTVWASHGDRIEQPPPGFRITATSANAPLRRCSMRFATALLVCCFTPRSRTRRGGVRSSTTSCSGSAAARPTGRRVTSSTTRSGAFGSSSAPARGHLRAFRWRGFGGRGGSRASGRRRPADLHLRGSRPAAPQRTRPGGADVRQHLGLDCESSMRHTRS